MFERTTHSLFILARLEEAGMNFLSLTTADITKTAALCHTAIVVLTSVSDSAYTHRNISAVRTSVMSGEFQHWLAVATHVTLIEKFNISNSRDYTTHAMDATCDSRCLYCEIRIFFFIIYAVVLPKT